MTVYVAEDLLIKIDKAIEKDQGATFRDLEKRILPTIEDAYRGEEEGNRSHLGASVLGEECARKLWYGFRWALEPKFDAKTLRLFNRGHLEEGRFVAMLMAADVNIVQQDEEGHQFRISHADGHVGGSSDGHGKNVPPFHPETICLFEFKTHSEKSFLKLAGKEWKNYFNPKSQHYKKFTGEGVKKSKFIHYVQMQLYMGKMGLGCGVYMAVNKNTDHIYAELLQFDQATYDQFLDRGEKIVQIETPPPRVSESPGAFACIFCDFRQICHFNADPLANCRTCKYSKPIENAEWWCRYHKRKLSKEEQRAGCPDYKKIEEF